MTLTLDPGLSRRLLLVPAAALCIGSVIILHWSVDPALRLSGLLVWWFVQGRELDRFARYSARFRKLNLSASGQIRGLCREGGWQELELNQGTFVRRRYIWLRSMCADRVPHDTLLLQSRHRADDWRRLQVILAFRS